ncbi:MAG: DUF4105 domain-containing protein [Vulcanimicrobiota bacterium]
MNSQTVSRPWSNFQSVPTNLRRRPDGAVQIDNARWGFDKSTSVSVSEMPGRFDDLVVEPRHVKDVYLGVKPFAPTALAAHSVLIFEMDPMHPVTNSKGETDSGLVLSPEAHFHQGEAYDMKGSYEMVYQVGTWKDTVEKTTVREGLNQVRYKLNLSSEQKQQLLENSLELALQDHSGECYNLFTRSCHSVTVDLLNSVIPEEQQIRRDLVEDVHNPLAVLPPYGDVLLAGHDLLADHPREVVQTDSGAPLRATRGSRLVQKLSRHTGLYRAACTGLGALAGSLSCAALGPLGLCLVPGAAHLGRTVGETLARRANSVYTPAREILKGGQAQ